MRDIIERMFSVRSSFESRSVLPHKIQIFIIIISNFDFYSDARKLKPLETGSSHGNL